MEVINLGDIELSSSPPMKLSTDKIIADENPMSTSLQGIELLMNTI